MLMEGGHKMNWDEKEGEYCNAKVFGVYQDVKKAYEVHMTAEAEQGDFSERLLALVDDIVGRRQSITSVNQAGEVTQLIFRSDIRQLNDAISQYLSASGKEGVWLLFDNLDKGWPIFDVKPEDVRIITSLLEATRKLQRQFENRSLNLHAVVFLRNDIYQHMILHPCAPATQNPSILHSI